jgi:hypothetical protein
MRAKQAQGFFDQPPMLQRTGPQMVKDDAPPQPSPPREQQRRVEAAFTAVEPNTRSFPGFLKIAILISGASGSWALVIAAVKILARG